MPSRGFGPPSWSVRACLSIQIIVMLASSRYAHVLGCPLPRLLTAESRWIIVTVIQVSVIGAIGGALVISSGQPVMHSVCSVEVIPRYRGIGNGIGMSSHHSTQVVCILVHGEPEVVVVGRRRCVPAPIRWRECSSASWPSAS